MTITQAINAPDPDGTAVAFDPAVHFISLDRVRHEMRVPGTYLGPEGDTYTPGDSEDAILIPIVQSAVSYTARHVNIPILSQDVILTGHVNGEGTITIDDPFVRTVTSVATRPSNNGAYVDVDADQYRSEEPDNDMAAGQAIIFPNSQWPANFGVSVRYSRGITENYPELDALRSMVILRSRSDYDALNALPDESRTAFERLSGALRLPASLPIGAQVVT